MPGLPLVLGLLGGISGVALLVGFAMLTGSGIQLVILPAIVIPAAAAYSAWKFPAAQTSLTALLAIIAILLLHWKEAGGLVSSFYEDWLLSDMRLSREMRKTILKHSQIASTFRPDWFLSMLFVAAATFGPASRVSRCLALIVFAVALFPSGWPRLFEHIREIKTVFSVFLTYRAPVSGAPGVWIPAASFKRRVFAVSVAAVFFYTTGALAIYRCESNSAGMRQSVAAGSAVVLLPNLALLAFLSGSLASTGMMRRKIEGYPEGVPITWWERHANRLRASCHAALDPLRNSVRESEHLFLGIEPWLNFPILLDQRILHDHVYVVGRTGSGKTSIGLMQLLIQIIRGFQAASGWSPKVPVVIMDFKGDRVLLQTAREEAKRRGQTFRFFTLEPGKTSYKYNPVRGFDSQGRSLPQLVQLVLDALSLNHGSGYGRSYYSQRSRFLLAETLKAEKNIENFPDLYKALLKLGRERKADFREAFELVSVIESLTHYPQLITTREHETKHSEHVIRMDRVLEECEVVYFWLSTGMESIGASLCGKLGLFDFRTAQLDRQNTAKPFRQAYLIIDECQKLAGENFQEVLQQARSAGIATILANQSLADLRTPDVDLRPTVRTNTRAKLFFSVSEPEELRNLSLMSGEEIQHSADDEEDETVKPRLMTNQILAVGDHPQRLFLQVSGGSGYTQFGGLPVPVQTDWPISQAIREEREAMPWPSLADAPPGALVTSEKPVAQVETEVRRAAAKKYEQRILKFMEE